MANQLRSFFHADNHMAIPVVKIVQLVQEGIEHSDDLQDFYKYSLKDVANNIRNPGGRIPYFVYCILQGVFIKILKVVWMFNPFLNQLHYFGYWN